MKKLLGYLSAFLMVALVSASAFAQEGGAAPVSLSMYYAMSAAFVMGITSAVGALSQAKAATAALEAIGRNPGAAGKIQTPMIIALALIESLVIYGLVIAYLIQANIK